MPSPAAIGGSQYKPALSADIANVGGPQPTSLSSLYAGGQKPWQPAYGMAGYGQGLEMNPYQGGGGWKPPDTGGQPWYGPGSPWGIAKPGTTASVSYGPTYYGPGSPWGETAPTPGPFTGFNFGSGAPGGVTAGPTLSNGGPGSYNPAQFKPAMTPGWGARPQGAFGKPSIGYGGGYNPNTQMRSL